jgi:hypothetical protein
MIRSLTLFRPQSIDSKGPVPTVPLFPVGNVFSSSHLIYSYIRRRVDEERPEHQYSSHLAFAQRFRNRWWITRDSSITGLWTGGRVPVRIMPSAAECRSPKIRPNGRSSSYFLARGEELLGIHAMEPHVDRVAADATVERC